MIVLIRHAHTRSNDERTATLSGRTDVPLSPRGSREVVRLRRRLSGSRFDAVYTSPLRRAVETAAAIVEPGGAALRRRGLQEIDCGLLDGWPLEDVRSRFPDLWAANLRQEDERFRWPGGESYREFRARCLREVRTLSRIHSGGRIAVVTHAGMIAQVIGFLSGTGAACWDAARPGTTALSVVEWRRGGAGRVIRFDDRAHLT